MFKSNILGAENKKWQWTPERVYMSYRIFLAAALLLIYKVNTGSDMGRTYPELFEYAAFTYLAISILSAIFSPALMRLMPRWSPLIPVIVDILFLTTFIHASGGLGNNLGVLMMVSVAAANILLPGRVGIFVAALATISVLFEQFWFGLQQTVQNPFHLTEPALLGVSFFAIAVITRQIVQRLDRSEALSEQRQQALIQLEALNKQIVQRMRTGIMVIDDAFIILLANPSAQALFPDTANLVKYKLPESLRQLYYGWRMNPTMQRPSIQFSPTGPTVLVRFASLHAEQSNLTLVFLEDHRQLAHEAQQMKLNSLGRMSATIAHEIRNPLSAINHAADLLADGQTEPEDVRLLEIIHSHVKRVNQIVDDVLGLSRRPSNASLRFPLKDAISRLQSSLTSNGFPDIKPIAELAKKDIEIRFDPDQLDQVLFNLASNAFRHGGNEIEVTLSAGIDSHTDLPWLRIRDNGVGVDPEEQKNLFEPFYTTSKQGTGLGLFVCRELCEGNQARLEYEPHEDGAGFIITFSHPDRVFQ
ncbi:MAG: ATP-binding protein [Alcanivoracaceae bacterium]|nr:ATP-binding protein [Alcanivoracaceae bacterium]